LIDFTVRQFGKAPGFAALTFCALLSDSLLCAARYITGGEYVLALGIILGAHFGGGAIVARRDNLPAANGGATRA
jgi:hypothetical protein